jgi:hypothetical protein
MIGIGEVMNSNKLDKIIRDFWEKEKFDDRYYLGYCSEVAVALDRFLKKAGLIGKHGWFHTIYIYDGWYWDIRGKMDKRKLDINMSVGALDEPRPATKDEIQHINDLLNVEKVNHIIKGLKEAQKNMRKL